MPPSQKVSKLIGSQGNHCAQSPTTKPLDPVENTSVGAIPDSSAAMLLKLPKETLVTNGLGPDQSHLQVQVLWMVDILKTNLGLILSTTRERQAPIEV